jgi:hypothetical protein
VKTDMQLEALLAAAGEDRAEELKVFARLIVGVIEELDQGLISASDAVRSIFHADNCLFIRKHFRKGLPDRIMSRGVQLPDLFDALPVELAYREFKHELATMRSLCLKILETRPLVA